MNIASTPGREAIGALLRDAAFAQILPRAHAPAARLKDDGSWVTDADIAMQRALQVALAARWPDVALLGEEMSVQQQAALLRDEAATPDGPGLWVLDPLDGTSNFAAGLPAFGPSLAWLQGGRVRAGWVFDVMRDELFSAVEGGGSWLGAQRLRAPRRGRALRQAMACVDFKRLPAALAARLATAPPYASQRAIGSVALEWCWVAAGRFDVYLHGAQGLWDYAAAHLILSEAGGVSRTFDGEPVFAQTLHRRSALCAGDPELIEAWSAWLASPRSV